jgi:hypothetical protein
MKNSIDYLSKSPKYTSPSAVTSYFYKELDLKNQNISELKRRINELLNDKALMQKQINALQNRNYASHTQCEQNEISLRKEHEAHQTTLMNRITALEKENTFLKQKLTKKETIANSINDTIEHKLHKQESQITNLNNLNQLKDNILFQMQIFYNKLNRIVNAESFRNNAFIKELDYKVDDINEYFSKLNEIEYKVLLQMNYDSFHNNTNYFKANNNTLVIEQQQQQQQPQQQQVMNIRYDDNVSNVNEELPYYLKGTNYEKLINYMKDNEQYNRGGKTCITHPEDCVANRTAREMKRLEKENNIKRIIYEKEISPVEYAMRANVLSRTPPRDEDFISNNSSSMNYLKTVNSKQSNGHSRKNYNFYP